MIGGKDFKSKNLLNLCSGHFTLKIPMVGNYYNGMSDPFQCGWKCRRGIFREPLDVHSIEASISTEPTQLPVSQKPSEMGNIVPCCSSVRVGYCVGSGEMGVVVVVIMIHGISQHLTLADETRVFQVTNVFACQETFGLSLLNVILKCRF